MKIVLVILFVLLGVIMTAVVLMQVGKNEGLGAIGGMGDSYWSKNRSRSFEGNLEKFTRIAAVLFFVVALVLDIIW